MTHTDPAPRAGVVALLGWTNVGKSTLLNRLVGDKLAAVADVAQTTRTRIRGILNLEGRGQIVIVDTPGIHEPRFRMNRAMIEHVHETLRGIDVALLLIDAARGLGKGDERAAELVRPLEIPRLVALNKIDEVRPKTRLLPMMQLVSEQWGFEEVLAISARTGEGCDDLVETVIRHLPESSPIYPEDEYTDQTERSLAAEWIREKILHLTRQELPHATAVLIERWHVDDRGLLELDATILVERDSQKQIVIGRGGSLIKEVGTLARKELEELLGRRVHLNLWVKVRRDWRNDRQVLHELGLD